MSAGTSQQVTIWRQAMACTFCLVVPATLRHAFEAGCAALDEIDRMEEKLSIFRPESCISVVNRCATERAVAVDPEVFEVLETAARVSGETDGAFDITAGSLSRAWGFVNGPKRVPAEPVRIAALASSGHRYLELDAAARTVRFRRPDLELNLGAIGKGYALDRALAVAAREFGVNSALMHGGQSSVKAIGTPPGERGGWKVAIGDPYAPGRSIAAVRLLNRAMGTSGTAYQYFAERGRRYGHVLDPRTGWPAEHLASATALAPTAAEADALSTAFFVMGVEGTRAYVRSHTGVAAVLVTRGVKNRVPEVVALGLRGNEIDFFPQGHIPPAAARRQPMPGSRPAGFFDSAAPVRGRGEVNRA